MSEKTTITDPYSYGISIADPDATDQDALDAVDWSSIDWTQPDCTEAVLEARTSIAADLHYLYMTHLTMLGGIVQEEPDMDRKRLASTLIDDRMRTVDAWSKYLTTLKEPADVTAEMDEHADDLLAEDGLCRLASIVLADVFVIALYEQTDSADSLFHAVLERDVRQAQHNLETAVGELQQWHRHLPDDREAAVADRISTCVQWTEVYVDRHHAVLETAGIDADQFAAAFRRNAQQFYRCIQPDDQ